ncbi:putative methyltransferase PMT4 [Hibiscus syriacus]|uniref:Methyltransferase n=1 Tax=Hibiscus syriacus TaxID=106335 RepID=A0A6A3CEU6_HIBSY|nr:putative methyltransferase PMT4 [Hibiscus syriacus]
MRLFQGHYRNTQELFTIIKDVENDFSLDHKANDSKYIEQLYNHAGCIQIFKTMATDNATCSGIHSPCNSTSVGGTNSRRWIPIEERVAWPSRSNLNKNELALYGLHPQELIEDTAHYKTAIRSYWSLLSPLIFSDHPKRPGDEDPSPPYNMLRNVLDMNACYGGFTAALLEAGKSAWVMNVVPTSGPNYLPLILDRGYIGVLHNWCEAFPTYPRTYDMVHADGLLSLETSQHRRCTMLDLFSEIDRLLRPEWIKFAA